MVWFRSSAPDWPYYTQCSTIPQIPLAKGSERVSGWRREMASNHRYPALRQVLYPAKLSLHDGGSSPPNSVTQTGSRRTESRRVPGAIFEAVSSTFGLRATSGPCSPSLTSWRTVTATCGASSGGRTRVSALEGRSISRYTIPA